MYNSIKSPYYLNRPISATVNKFRNSNKLTKMNISKTKKNEVKMREINFNKAVNNKLNICKINNENLIKNLIKEKKSIIKNRTLYKYLIDLNNEKKLNVNKILIKSYKPNKFYNNNKHFQYKISKEGFSRNKLGTFYYK